MDTRIPKAVLIGALLWALSDSNPYGYYQFLRVACFAGFAFFSYLEFRQPNVGAWAWTFSVFAILYNPFFRIALNRDVWEIVNIVTAVVLAVSVAHTSRSRNGQKKSD